MSKENVETPAVEEVVEAPVEETPAAVVEEVKPVEAVEEPTAISLPKEETTGPGLGDVAEGAIGSTQVKAKAKPKVEVNIPEPVVADKVAIYSSRNVSWDGVGRVYVGFNIVTPENAEKWLKRNHTRLATPEEVAKEFAK